MPDLHAIIDANVYTNNNNEITAQMLRQALYALADNVGTNLTGFVAVDSLAELPDPGVATLGYLVGENLYLYVGTGGDTLGGKYKNVGRLQGPAGPQGVGFSSITTNEDGTIDITLTTGDIITIDLNHEHPQYETFVETSVPVGGMLPNTFYRLGTLDSDTTFVLAPAQDSAKLNNWMWSFAIGASIVNITWPAAISKWAGGTAPEIKTNKYYEISVVDGIAVYMEV